MREKDMLSRMVRRFEDSWLAMHGAGEKLDALQKEVSAFLEPQGGWVDIDLEEDGWHVARFRRDGPSPPRRWGRAFGEVATDLRSALDYLVYSLSDEAGGRPDEPSARTQWPIFTKAGEYPKWRGKMLRGVPDRSRAVIDWLQPFDTPSDSLALLDRLTDHHKHRTILPTVIVIDPSYIAVGPADGEPRPFSDFEMRMAPAGTPLVSEAEIGRVRLRTKSTEHMDVKAAVRLDIGFGVGRIPLAALRDIGLYVASILRRFEPFDAP